MKEFLDQLDSGLYRFLTERWEILPKRFVKWLAYYFPDARVRKVYQRKLNVFMGEGTYANIGLICVNDVGTPVYIGDHVSIAPNCVIVACSGANNGTTINDIPYVRDTLTKKAPVVVEDEVWLGAGVTILPGVTVRHHCVIGAGSVVTRSTEPYGVYAGVPARRVRELKEEPQMFEKECQSSYGRQAPPPLWTIRKKLTCRAALCADQGEAA